MAFDVDGPCRLAAESVNQSPANVVNLSKLAEGRFNRTFLITLRDHFQMVARIPYPITAPKFYAVAGEVATLEFLRSSRLPVLKLYGYSSDSDNAAKTEHIFVEFVRGFKLSDQDYRDHLVHHHYVTSMEELHYAAPTDHMYALRSHLFQHAGSPWEGETFELRLALMQATERWEALTGGGVPCPVESNAEDVRETRKLNEVQVTADMFFEMWQNMVGLGEEGWVLTEDYEDAVAFFEKKEALGGAKSAAERAEIMGRWPWDEMDEGKYMSNGLSWTFRLTRISKDRLVVIRSI